jgi:hypothetical protein
MNKLGNIARPNRTKVDSSCSSSGLKDEKIYKLAPISGLGKSSLPTDKLSAVRKPQDNLNESVPTTISLPSSSSVKNASSEQVSTQEKTELNSGTNASKVKLPSSETVAGGNLTGKSTGSRHNLNSVPTISQNEVKPQQFIPKSAPWVRTIISILTSFDNLHDTVQRSVPKGKPPNHITLTQFVTQRISNVSPNNSHVNNHSLKKSASEGSRKCPKCEYLIPAEQTDNYYQLVDIPPPGTNWKCKLCGQWRP